MSILAKDGLRIHHIVKRDDNDFAEIGQTRTAICGTEWQVSVVDPELLADLPLCYDCTGVRYLRAHSLASSLKMELYLADLEFAVDR